LRGAAAPQEGQADGAAGLSWSSVFRFLRGDTATDLLNAGRKTATAATAATAHDRRAAFEFDRGANVKSSRRSVRACQI